MRNADKIALALLNILVLLPVMARAQRSGPQVWEDSACDAQFSGPLYDYKVCQSNDAYAQHQQAAKMVGLIAMAIASRFSKQVGEELENSQKRWNAVIGKSGAGSADICGNSEVPAGVAMSCTIMGSRQRIAFLDWAYGALEPRGHGPHLADPAIDGKDCASTLTPQWVCADQSPAEAAKDLDSTIAGMARKPSARVIPAWTQYEQAACASVAALHTAEPSQFPTRQQCLDVLERQFGELVSDAYAPIGNGS